jgi:kinesin family protein 11
MERIFYESIGAKQSMSQKWDQLNKLMNDMRIEQIKENTSFQKSTSDMINKLNEATVSNQEFKDKITVKVEEFSDRIVKEENVGLENVEGIDDLNTKNTQQIMNNLNQINDKNTLFANQTKALITQSEEFLAKELKESIQMNDDVIKTTDKQLNAKRIAVTEMSEKLTDELEEEKALVSSINENIENITECVSDKTSEMIRMATTMQNSYVREIDHRFKDFEKFVKNDLIKDIPTGTTPQKTQYCYPRDLVQTSPHERILERFRQTLDANDAINISLPEETDSEFLSDCSNISEHSSSSVMSNANNENIKPLTTNTKGTKARFGLKVKSNSDLKTQLECDPIDALDKKITSNCNKDNTKKVSLNVSTKPMPLKTNYTN